MKYVLIALLLLPLPLASAETFLSSGTELHYSGGLVSGIITINGKQYQAKHLEFYKGTNPILGGTVAGNSDTYRLILTGKYLGNYDYNFNGFLFTKNGYESVNQKITIVPDNVQTMTKPENLAQNTENPHLLKILVRQPERVYFNYVYFFTVKAFDLTKNPNPTFDSFYGLVSGVNVTAVVKDKINGDVQKSFTGFTNKYGYYQDWYKVIYYPIHPDFQVIFNASKNGYVPASDVENLFILHLPASYYGGNSTR